MPKAPNPPNAVQPTSRARAWQADGSGGYPVTKPVNPDTGEDVQAFVDLVESTRPATDNQLERVLAQRMPSSKK